MPPRFPVHVGEPGKIKYRKKKDSDVTGGKGIEPLFMVLETIVIPLYHPP